MAGHPLGRQRVGAGGGGMFFRLLMTAAGFKAH